MTRRPLARAAAAIAVVLVAVPLWAVVVEPALLRNEDYTLSPPGWPATCDGLRVAVLSDLHVGSPFNGLDKLQRIVDLSNRAQPDVVLLAGDYVIHGVPGGRFVPPEESAPWMGRIVARAGVYAVLGNHDWWLGGPRVRAALEDAGIPVLDDAGTPVVAGACRFWLAGIGDLWEGTPDVPAALAGAADGDPVLAFTHNPDLFVDAPARIGLLVAGHTHGGQVYLPIVGRPVVPSKYGERFAIGHIVEDGRHLFVTSGLGTSIVPARFRVPPEISVLTLRSAAPPAPDGG